MSRSGAAPRAASSVPRAPRRARAPVSKARAEASRKNGAKSRGPRTPEGKARSARNALKHGLRATRHVLLPQEDGAAFAALEKALLAELAPVGALQIVLAQRIVSAAWRLARADRMEAEVLEFRSYDAADTGLALMRESNGSRSIETLVRYRNAAMAEFTRALRILQALQARHGEHDARRATRPAPVRKPKEPEKARNITNLASGNAAIAAVPAARRPQDGAHAGPEPSLESLIRPALQVLRSRAALEANRTQRSAARP